MRRKNAPRSIATVLRDMFSSPSVEGKLRQGRIIAAWEDVIGERIGEQVEKSWLKDGKLFVRIKSPVWRQELHLNRASWCRRLNDELDGDEVTEIVFR